MTLTEKAAYLKGLVEGLSLDQDKPETKIINAMMDVIDDLTLTVSDLDDSLTLISEQVDAVDEDLDELESYVYEEDDDDDYDDDDCCEYYEVKCPACGEEINIDESILEEGSIECPACGETLEFDFDCCDCEECSEDKSEEE